MSITQKVQLAGDKNWGHFFVTMLPNLQANQLSFPFPKPSSTVTPIYGQFHIPQVMERKAAFLTGMLFKITLFIYRNKFTILSKQIPQKHKLLLSP
jgi:hypothetical protein